MMTLRRVWKVLRVVLRGGLWMVLMLYGIIRLSAATIDRSWGGPR
jgi:hypothetical protein